MSTYSIFYDGVYGMPFDGCDVDLHAPVCPLTSEKKLSYSENKGRVAPLNICWLHKDLIDWRFVPSKIVRKLWKII